ncbi:hypothetical protein NEPTK9_000630 [Candidatus Neptunochlamydia vexilliferae]|uniref:Uncharacterized protein n=1 Tax=Candidatus Neptunichlamydia vexilliferae TaxID=1651774 RepID=A0ABS0AYB9_9BACT|nr:hypothetical protein [Candidatus Neptunochlamydia vexilliferae]
MVEFKLDKSADAALEQADFGKYKEKYSQGKQDLVVLGVNFSSDSRNISDWKGDVFSSSGEKVKTIQSEV